MSTAAVPTGPIEDIKTSHELKNEAATAALYLKLHDRSEKQGQEFLDKNQKLSSAGAAASLKYAQPQDLPSYPTSGLKKGNLSAAGAAASLGWANQKPFEHWKPDASASASAAAMRAKDYKMAPLWEPQASSNGAKAALLAAKDGGKVEIWRPESDPAWGNSAATQAFKKFGAGTLSPQLDYGYTQIGRAGSKQAATGAMRPRADSTPNVAKAETYPDEKNAATNALSAATSANKTGRSRAAQSETGAVPYTTLAREMFTANPPVAPEVDERNHNNTLRASAIAMAQGMYKVAEQKREALDAQMGARSAHRRGDSSSSVLSEDPEPQPVRYENLHEAAHKLAQERLAKLHDEHAKNREYREYYAENAPAARAQQNSRLSFTGRGRQRRRAASAGSLDSDRAQSNKIRQQMTIFSANVSQIDEAKRAKDREALIAAAQRNVTKSLHGMDERVFKETGKIAPSLLSEWEVKAAAAAQASSDARMENQGKVHIGNNKFIDQSAIDAVARRNVQPLLDEINEKAEAERERQAALKLEQDTKARKAAEKKEREREVKEAERKLKLQQKEEEKARKAELKEQKAAKKENRKSETVVEPATETPETETATETATDPAAETTESKTVPPIRTSMEDQASLRMQENADAANPDLSTPLSPGQSKDGGKVKNWLKNRFSRRMSKTPKSPTEETEKDGFVGGAALTGATSTEQTKEEELPSSAAIKAEHEEEEERVGRSKERTPDVSTLPPVEKTETADEDDFQEARDNFDEDLAPPPTFPAEKSSSPVRDSKFVEEI